MKTRILLFVILLGYGTSIPAADPFPNTKPLTLNGDLASKMVDGIDKFLLAKTEQAAINRTEFWNRDTSSWDAHSTSIEKNRKRLAHRLGLRDTRHKTDALEMIASTSVPAKIAENDKVEIFAVRWNSFGEVYGEGLYLKPKQVPIMRVIAIPSAGQSPADLAGISEAETTFPPFARQLSNAGCEVVIPTIISRTLNDRRSAKLTDREYIYRPAFEMGRHILGYELQTIFSIVDFFEFKNFNVEPRDIGIIGWGDGGQLAMYAAALDTRIHRTFVSGYFTSRQNLWQEPIDRNVFGLLEQFGDAEIASLIAPRKLIIDASNGPELDLKSENRGAPGRLLSPNRDVARKEVERTKELLKPLEWDVLFSGAQSGAPMHPKLLIEFMRTPIIPFDDEIQIAKLADVKPLDSLISHDADAVAKRQQRIIGYYDRHTQQLLAESPYMRAEYMKALDTGSIEAFEKSTEIYREKFRTEIIGAFDDKLLLPNPKSREVYNEEKWTGYEVVLDVYDDVFAFGILLMPKDIKTGEKRPVVVCQHGLEGRPRDTIEKDHRAYHNFAAKLCEKGYIVFAPQNPYIFKDRFRSLQRKANSLGKTLFSIIVPQHQQITDWLVSLPMVDKDRIAFYGLSYGGKTAMRVPALVDNYCLSICSADFNDWIWKNASTRARYSYVWTGEYEIFEFDLGNTFNYSDMAALIAPRPFMVERGHFDGVAPDDRVAAEFAKVRHLYQAKLGIGDRCELEWFVGPHTINGKGTFEFLDRHLKWSPK